MLNNDYEKINIEITIPLDLAPFLKRAEGKNMSFALILYPLIQNGELSYGQAADILKVNKNDLLDYYGENNLPYFNDDPDELADEINIFSNDKRLMI